MILKIFFLVGLAATAQAAHVQMESAKFSIRSDLKQLHRAHSSRTHQVHFALKQRNLDRLKEALMEVSHPSSPKYGQHWSKKDVDALTVDPEASAAVLSYLHLHHPKEIKVVKRTLNDEYITLEASIQTWETVLNTQFFEFQQTALDGDLTHTVVRALDYSLPQALLPHVEAVWNTVDFPAHIPASTAAVEAKVRAMNPMGNVRNTKYQSQSQPKKQQSLQKKSPAAAATGPATATTSASSSSFTINNVTTPAFLNWYYNINNNTGSTSFSQVIYGSLDQYYSEADLLQFEHTYISPTYSLLPSDVGGHNMSSGCYYPTDDNPNAGCDEANLDVQYMMGVSRVTPTTFWYTEMGWIPFLFAVASSDTPTSVISISYAALEMYETESITSAFAVEAQKLGLMGTTVVSSSGDDGVAGYIARTNPAMCNYNPYFPGVCPYVTVVGGTMGPQYGLPEVACMAGTFDYGHGPEITTGGGFSFMYDLPSWQSTAVNSYFSTAEGQAAFPGHSRGRGFPDLSLISATYQVIMNGVPESIYGTSASTPVVAGMINLLNSAREKKGLSRVGWLNPALYALYDQGKRFTYDIEEGSNNCCAYAYVCCEQGFSSAPGWDPLTGLGAVNYTAFEEVFLNIPIVNSATPAPTRSPNAAPITLSPALQPSAMPVPVPDLSMQWVQVKGYSTSSCDDEDNVVNYGAIPTNKCFQKYNTSGYVVGSYLYQCTSSMRQLTDDGFIKALLSNFEDGACTVPTNTPPYVLATDSCTQEGNISYSFSLYQYPGLWGGYRGWQMSCIEESNALEELPEEQSFFTVTTFGDEYCQETAVLEAFKEGFCFQFGLLEPGSYRFQWPNITIYSDNFCHIPSDVTTVTTTCESDIGGSSYYAVPVASQLTVQYGTYVNKDDDDDDSTVLSTGAIAGIVIACVVVTVAAAVAVKLLFFSSASASASAGSPSVSEMTSAKNPMA